VTLLRDNVDIIKKHTKTLTDSSNEVGLEVNTEKTKYMLLSRHKHAEQNREIKVVNRSFGNIVRLRYLGPTRITNQNLIQEEIKRGLNLDNACYHSAHNFPSSRFLSKKT
jgi:hypothetical protein